MEIGTIQGTSQGLNISPNIHLSCISEGVYVRYTSRLRYPCLFTCSCCTDIHTKDNILVLFVDDDTNFLTLIRGKSYNLK